LVRVSACLFILFLFTRYHDQLRLTGLVAAAIAMECSGEKCRDDA